MASTSTINTGTKILNCTCKDKAPHALGQDFLYGDGKRLHNGCRDGWRCTVCGTKK
jgi:hypothetical protein